MAKFEVVLNGENYLFNVNGEKKRMGFYVTRYIETDNPDDAERLAIASVRSSEKLRALTLNSDKDPPSLSLEEMYEIDSFSGLETLEPGFGFYEEE